jgi:uncharacterized protein YegP (UPF0339 family)
VKQYRSEKIEVYRARDGWRWRYVAANGKVMADSGEAYDGRKHAVHGALHVAGLSIVQYQSRVMLRVGLRVPSGYLVNGRIYYMFEQRYTDRSHDVELVERP